MIYGVITRGATFVQAFPLPNALNKTDLIDFTIVYRQKNRNVLIKRKDDIEQQNNIDEENNIVAKLSQSETLMFDPKIKFVEMQIKAQLVNNEVKVLGTYRLRLDECFDVNEFDID